MSDHIDLADLIDLTTNKFGNEVTDAWLRALTNAVLAAGYRKIPDGHIVIHAPTVNHKAATVTDASALRRVATNLDRNHYAGGSNVRAAVSSALRSIATALDEAQKGTAA